MKKKNKPTHPNDVNNNNDNNNCDLDLTTSSKTLFLGALYFIQGFPYGFQDKLIPLLLIVKGHSPSTVGLIRLLLLPWLAKALFAPMIDMTLTITKWVQISLFGLMLVSLFNTFWPDSTIHNHDEDGGGGGGGNNVSRQFIITLFLLNFFSAFQDIAVDAIAVNIYTKQQDMMTGNVAQIVGYKLGAFFGSGVLFWIYNLFDWNGLFATLTLIYLGVLLVFNANANGLMAVRMVDDDHNNDDHQEEEVEINGNKSRSTFDQRQLQHDENQQKSNMLFINTTTMISYVLIYKLGETSALATYPYFLLSVFGVSSHQMAFWNGTIGSICSIAGSLFASRFSITILNKLIKFRLLPLFFQLLIIGIHHHHQHQQHQHFDLINFSTTSTTLIHYASLVSILSLNFIGGLITTMTFTLMMMACQKMPKSFRATRFTLLSSVEVFGKLIFAPISGFLVESFGFLPAYIIFVLLSIVPCLVLPDVRSMEADDKQIGK